MKKSKTGEEASDTLAAMETSEKKLAMMFAYLHKYLEQKYKAKAFEGQTFNWHKAQQF